MEFLSFFFVYEKFYDIKPLFFYTRIRLGRSAYNETHRRAYVIRLSSVKTVEETFTQCLRGRR